MKDRASRAPALSIALMILLAAAPGAGGQEKPAEPPKKVLVELFTSQGCDSCPPASDLLGKLAGMGHGPDRVVAINFHVDYFNKPWADPYSDPAFSRRQREYNDALGRDDLYFTPLMMVDGRRPLLGSDRPKALAALQTARKEAPGVALDLDLDGKGAKKTLSVKIAARSDEVAGRDLLIGVALTEDPVTTKVPGGENAGRTLVEHHVVRRLDRKFLKLDRTTPRSIDFPLELAPGWDASRFRVAVFAQDRANGKVYQADAIPWGRAGEPVARQVHDHGQKVAPRKARRSTSAASFFGFDPSMTMMGPPASDEGTEMTCPDCGSSFIPPIGPIILRSGRAVEGPPVVLTC